MLGGCRKPLAALLGFQQPCNKCVPRKQQLSSPRPQGGSGIIIASVKQTSTKGSHDPGTSRQIAGSWEPPRHAQRQTISHTHSCTHTWDQAKAAETGDRAA